MKEDMRGKHGKTGRKPTGRKRKYTLPPKFTKDERDAIMEKAKESELKQADFILKKIIGDFKEA